MKNQETGKVNASLVISMIALFVAVSGAATAAKNSNGPSTKLPPNSVGTAQLKPGAVTTTDLAKNSVVTSKVAPKAITVGDIAARAVTTTALAPNSVTTLAIAPEAVKSSNLGKGSVLLGALGPGAVTTEALATDAVDSSKIKDDSIGASQIKTGAVTGPKLQDGAVETGKLGTGAVTNQKLSDQAVDKEKIKDGAVDSAQLKEGAVTSQKIGQGAVLAGKLGERAVTPAAVEAPPGALVSASNVPLAVTGFVCMGKIPDFTSVSRNVDGVFDPGQPSRLTAPIDGIYRVTASLIWPDDPDGTRMLWVRRYSSNDTYLSTQSVSSTPVVDQTTDQALSTDFVMEAGDYVTVTALTCPITSFSTITQASFGMTWAGPAS